MAYVAIKPCCFAGQRFKIGESIPAEFLQPGAAKNLVKMGIIAEAGSEAASTATTKNTIKSPTAIKVVVHTGEGDMPLELTPEGLQSVFDALTANAAGAESVIQEMTDEDALILLNATDNRKTVKALTEERAGALSEAAEAPEEGEEPEEEETLEEDEEIAEEDEESEGEE